MISNFARILSVASALCVFSLVFIGCGGGETAPAPAGNAAAAGGATKPKAPPVKGKGGQMIESEENTPKRFRDRDN